MTPLSRRFIIATLALGPAGCGPLLSIGGAPPRLYTLTPASNIPPGSARFSGQLLVDVPVSSSALDTERIALSRGPTMIDYFADAAWTDRAPVMVQSLLVQSFENSERIIAIARESLELRADFILRPELRHFEAEYGQSGPPNVHVQIEVKLIKMPDRAIVNRYVADASVPAAENQIPAIVDAFNAALHKASGEIIDWTLRR